MGIWKASLAGVPLDWRTFKDDQARLQLFALAYSLTNFLWRLALPKRVGHWSLTTLRENLVKIGAKVTRHSKSVTFQLAEVAVTRDLLSVILDRIARLAIPPPLVAMHPACEGLSGQKYGRPRGEFGAAPASGL